jgi:hypothetical protein
MHSLLHVSVHLDHPQGADADPCLSYTFVVLSVKHVVTSFAVLWQHAFQAVMCTTARNTCSHNTAKLLTV